jgi:O-antigen ligase
MRKLLNWILALYLPATCWTIGIEGGGVTVTAATLLLLCGCAITFWMRWDNDRPIVSLRVLREPAIVCSLIYFVVGVASGACADDKDRYIKEVVQRTMIILMPAYLYVFGPADPRPVGRAILLYIAMGSILGLTVFLVGLKGGLHSPVYLLGMHKNTTGADCAQTVLMCFALLISRQFPGARSVFVGLIVLGFLGMIGAQSRASALGAVLAVFLMLLAMRVRLRYVVAVGLAFAVGFVVMLNSLPKDTIESAVTTRRFSSNETRQAVWKAVSRKLTAEPFTCVGWGNYLPLAAQMGTGDCASIFYYDWGQMSLVGLVAQMAMIGTCLYLPVSNLLKYRQPGILTAMNLCALGIICDRFFQSYLDSFWIGRGPTLSVYAAVGMALYSKLWLQQMAVAQKMQALRARKVTVSSAH